MNPFDPEDYPLRPTVRRLSHLWWGERRLVLVGLACALGYTTLTLSVSVLIQRVIDHAIVPGHPSDLWPYVVAILGLALVRFWVNFTRRYATARVGVRLEARLRELLYAGYLRFPRAFYDLHPTGPGRLAGDQRPVPDPLLHRLGRRPGRPERHDDHRRRDRAGAREPAADAVLGRGDTADRVRRLALRPPRDADLAPGAGAQGRRHRGGRRGGRRASRWCRRSGARTTCASASAARRRRCATWSCARPASSRSTCRRCSSCPRSRSPPWCSSAAAT